MTALKRVTGKTVAFKSAPARSKPAPRRKPATDALELTPVGAVPAMLASAIAKLIAPPFEPLIGPPAGKLVKATGSLLGPGTELPDPKASYPQNLAALKQSGVPRFARLTPLERQHETAFADDVEQHLEHFIEGAELLAKDDLLGTMVFEPDGLKRLYAPYGTGAEPASAAERQVRVEANHALHPTATLVARLAFLKRLNQLAKLPPGDPQRTVFATSGGCAAGKGDMDEAVKLQLGGFPFGAMWDSAGESDGLENAWVLQAVEARGLGVVFAFAANDPADQYQNVLDRGERTGRYVDVVTFASSYVEGTKNVRAFLQSPQYLQAKAAGTATTMAMFMGDYDPLAETDPKRPHYPDARLLGENGLIGADDVPPTAQMHTIVASALATLEAAAKQARANGKDADLMLTGALGTAEKFARSGVLK